MATATRSRSSSSRSLTKTRQVANYLASGKSLTAAQAESKFGVKNLRAMISDIREQFEKFGNWQVNTDTNSRGQTVYSMEDTHPGTRTYGFDAEGNRYIL